MSKPLAEYLLIAATGLSVASCSPLPSYRYEITLEIDTPAGVRTGSSVVEISGRREPKLLPDMVGASLTFHGEAAAVDLPSGGTIFALLAGENGAGGPTAIALNLLTPAERASVPELEAGKVLGKVDRTAELPRAAYPLLVTFHDPTDPNSIEGVDPDSEVQFGRGGRLRRITISTTHKPFTDAIEKRLPWLSGDTRLIVQAPDGVRHVIWGERFKS
jgi:hypothetical protein